MIGYVLDDGGRQAAGFKGAAGDCVTRAFAILTGMEYREAYRLLADMNALVAGSRSARNGLQSKVYEPVFKGYGLHKVKLPAGPRPTYSEAYAAYGNCIVKTTHHVCAIVDGNLHDIFDGRTYEWQDTGDVVERKAQSVWIMDVLGGNDA